MKKIFILTLSFFICSSVCASERLTVLLDWFANPDHAPLFVAEQQGFFKEAGLDVKLLGPADPNDPPKLVAAGKADIAITYEPQFIEQVDQGLPLIHLATLIDKPLSCIAVLNTSGIYTVHDLKNKNIGYSTNGITGTLLDTMLTHNQLTANDVKKINVHYNLTQALLSKKIDAATGMMRTFEVIQMALEKQPVRIFLPEENGVPTYSELIFVIHKKNISDARILKFLTALKKGIDYLQKHPQESWEKFSATHPELNDTLNKKAWLATLPYFAKNPVKFNPQEWEKFAQFMQKNGLITTVHPMTDYTIER